MLMDFNNNFKCRMGREDLSHIQFNPKLWNLRPVVKDSGAAMRVPLLPEAYAHVKENQQAWLSRSRPLPDQCARYPPIRRMLLGVTSPVIAPRIGAARDAERKMLKWSEGMEPRFISWNVAAAHTFDFTFPDAWSRKKIKPPPSRRPEVSAEVWNEVSATTDDLSRLRWSGEVKVVMLEVAKECRGGSYITIEDLAPHGEESVEFLVNDELFYHAGDLTIPARPDSEIDTRQGPSGPKPKPDANDDELMDQDDDDIGGKTESRAVNQRVVKSKASAVVASLTSAGRSGESGQGDGATLTGGEKENLIPPMLLAGLTTTATKSMKTARTLADTKLEMEIISQCESGGLDDYRPSRTNMAKIKLEGQLDVVEYSRVTVPESVHMGDPAGVMRRC